MQDHSFEEVVKLDQHLYKLAYYEVTGGMIVVPKNNEETYELEDKIANKFNYFKKMIQNGECSYDFIKWHVLDQNGPFCQVKEDLEYPESLSNWEEEYNRLKGNQKTEVTDAMDLITKLLSSMSKDGNSAQLDFTVEPLEDNKVPPKITFDSIKKKKKKDPRKEE